MRPYNTVRYVQFSSGPVEQLREYTACDHALALLRDIVGSVWCIRHTVTSCQSTKTIIIFKGSD